MAQFWGQVRGGRTAVSRTGGKESGLDVVASGRTGNIQVRLSYDSRTHRELAYVRWHSKEAMPHDIGVSIWSGFLDGIDLASEQVTKEELAKICSQHVVGDVSKLVNALYDRITLRRQA